MIRNQKVLLVAFLSFILTGSSGLSGGSFQQVKQLAVGDAAPDFNLEDQSGQKHSLSSSRDKNPVVLVFYRGYW